MADIFLSYARADQPRIEKLAAALEEAGFTLWWDSHLRSGAEFADDIEAALNEAGQVIVAWSADAVKSRWVRDEASEAAEQNKLVSISLDDTAPPMGFRQFHATDMKGWKGGALPAALLDALGKDVPASARPAPSSGLKKRVVLAGAAIALALAGGTYVATQGLPGSATIAQAPVSLAVLPLTSSDEELAAKGPGLSSALSNGLASASGITMIAGTSTGAAAARKLSAREIGTELGATHLLEGQILPVDDDAVRVILSLVDTATGRQIWSDSIEGSRQITPRLTRELVSAAGLAMKARLGTGAAQRLAGSDISSEAYEAYLSALEKISLRFDDEDRIGAYRLLRRVTELAPDFAPGHASLAYIIANSPRSALGDEDTIRRQYNAAIERALSLDPGNVEARAAQAIGAYPWDRDVEAAMTLSSALIKDHPNEPMAQEAMAYALDNAGRHVEAHDYYERVLASDPLSEQRRVNMYNNYFKFGTFDGLEKLVARCKDCATTPDWLLFGFVMLDGDMADYERLWPDLSKQLVGGSLSQEEIDVLGAYLPAYIEGSPAPVPKLILDAANPFTVTAAYRTVGEEEALRQLQRLLDRDWPAGGVDFLTDKRSRLSPRLRATPTYHALFEGFYQQQLVEYRRKNGVMAGLPLDSNEVAAEERRLAKLDR
ncbi:TIR domain-containing protein [Qipengyuania aurantiaca]|uniref:TIR domain-containing protein n=1 Tax=Qipengyuania aurantiaca TaxID=2867233 RepID=A0ABX8ZP49_9SPHN|nr:TIR domain-containing protein [Qipengyuania aurantiaca]QZD89347.1 TIR domain-containing protein [Qipengyuania aurantiaca]